LKSLFLGFFLKLWEMLFNFLFLKISNYEKNCYCLRNPIFILKNMELLFGNYGSILRRKVVIEKCCEIFIKLLNCIWEKTLHWSYHIGIVPWLIIIEYSKGLYTYFNLRKFEDLSGWRPPLDNGLLLGMATIFDVIIALS
jgi:hypothetical protein